ncbi:MAG: DUF4097 family beta strand repeat protein [Roseiflexaceae bacterium]|nr:DUF4097 family beta strand repeat protein [Roseiflexaceae bacterium]
MAEPEYTEAAYRPRNPLPDEPFYQPPVVRRNAGRTIIGGVLLGLGVIWLLGMLATGALWSSSGESGDDGVLIDQTFQAQQLDLEVPLGDVEVRGWDEATIGVVASYDGGSAADYQVTTEVRDGVLVIRGGPQQGLFSLGQREITYVIQVPAAAAAQIKTTNGSIDVAELNGVVTLDATNGGISAQEIPNGLIANTVNGSIELQEIGGALEATSVNGSITLDDGAVKSATVNTTNGEIELNGVSGEVTIESVNGRIEIENAREAHMRVSSTNADIRVVGTFAPGRESTFNTVSGDISLRFEPERSFAVEASTVGGEIWIEHNFAFEAQQQEPRSLIGRVGSGGATLNISTTSGDIRLISPQ